MKVKFELPPPNRLYRYNNESKEVDELNLVSFKEFVTHNNKTSMKLSYRNLSNNNLVDMFYVIESDVYTFYKSYLIGFTPRDAINLYKEVLRNENYKRTMAFKKEIFELSLLDNKLTNGTAQNNLS